MSRSAAQPAKHGRRTVALVTFGGLAIIAGLWWVRVLSDDFLYGTPMLDRPIREFVAILAVLGIIQLIVIAVTTRTRLGAGSVVFILAAGCLMRALFFGTNPVLEDDYYRYLWDGAVTANGINPYTVAPEYASTAEDTRLGRLARDGRDVLPRVNHPSLTTVYPPVTQIAFAVAHAVRPWSLDAWRGVLAVVEGVICALLLLMLHRCERPLHWVLIYWWNPLAIVVTMNAGHMDVVALPFVLAALLFALLNRPAATCIAGALAVCVKIWPLVLAPVLIRNLRAAPAQLGTAIVFGGAILLAVGSPMYAAMDGQEQSGLAAYSARWEMNDALFLVLLQGARSTAASFGFSPDSVQLHARIAVVTIVGSIVVLSSLRRAASPAGVANRLAIVIGVLFMMLPAQFPWYYLWALPFLAIAPRASLLALTATLPLYYLKFYFAAQDSAQFFHTRVVWVEYAPTLVLAAIEFGVYLSRRAARA